MTQQGSESSTMQTGAAAASNQSCQSGEKEQSCSSGSKTGKNEKPQADKGLGYFPISDLQFDVVTLVFEKSKALQAYDKYLTDCQANDELLKIFEQIKTDDKKHIEMLKNFLGNC